jgi:hypothetical protein
MFVSFAVVVCDRMTAALSARRPGAGRDTRTSGSAGPAGGLLGGKDPTGRFLVERTIRVLLADVSNRRSTAILQGLAGLPGRGALLPGHVHE